MSGELWLSIKLSFISIKSSKRRSRRKVTRRSTSITSKTKRKSTKSKMVSLSITRIQKEKLSNKSLNSKIKSLTEWAWKKEDWKRLWETSTKTRWNSRKMRNLKMSNWRSWQRMKFLKTLKGWCKWITSWNCRRSNSFKRQQSVISCRRNKEMSKTRLWNSSWKWMQSISQESKINFYWTSSITCKTSRKDSPASKTKCRTTLKMFCLKKCLERPNKQ